MFFIFGIDSKVHGVINLLDKNAKSYKLFIVSRCFSLFFIPIFFWGNVYYISADRKKKEISKEDYLRMKHEEAVMRSHVFASQSNEETARHQSTASCDNDFCPVCKKKMESDFLYCPFCSQKQPVKEG